MAAVNFHFTGESRREEAALLAMRREDSSWHPCRISLSSNGGGLEVEFVDDGSKEIISTRDDAIELLRIRSAPIQGADCSLIRVGDRVLANPKSLFREVFYEALVEERINAKHSKKRCTCNFVVRWTGGETAALPLSALMTVPATRIDTHPAIGAFFSNVPRGIRDSAELLRRNRFKKEASSFQKTLKNKKIVKKLFSKGSPDASDKQTKVEKEMVAFCPPMSTLRRNGGDASARSSSNERLKRILFPPEMNQNSRKSPRLD